MRHDRQLSAVQEYVFRHAYFFAEEGVLVVGIPKAGSTSLLAGFFAHEGKDPRSLLETAVSDEAEWDQGLWSFAGTLRGLLGNRDRKAAARIVSDRGIRKVAFVRHPLPRLVSSWVSKLLVAEPYFSEIAKQVLGPCFDTNVLSGLTPPEVAALLVESCRKLVSSKWFMADQHFCPQAHLLDWLPRTAEVLDFGRLDGEMRRLMPDSWGGLPRMNTTSGAPGVPITAEFEDLVQTAYAADFRRYGGVFSPYEPPAVKRSSQRKPWLSPGSGFLAHIRAARRLAPWVEAARARRAPAQDSAIADRDQALASQAKLLDERWALVQDLEKRIADRDDAIASQAKVIEDRWSIIEDGQRAIADRDQALASQARLLDERWALVQDLEKRIADRDRTIAAQASVLEERSALLQGLESRIADRDQALASQAKLLDERWALVQDLEKRIADRDDAIASQAKVIEDRWSIIEDGQRAIADRDQALASQAKLLDERWALVQDLEKRVTDRDRMIASQATSLDERQATIRSLERETAARDATIASQADALERLRLQDEAARRRLEEQDATIAAHRAQLDSRAFLTRRLATLCLPRKGRAE